MPTPNFWQKLGKFLVRTAENDDETSGSPRFKQEVEAIHKGELSPQKAALGRLGETASAFAFPLSGGVAGPIVANATNLAFAADGLYNLASGNGVQKTYRLAKQGDWAGAARSAGGDALNIAMAIPAIKLLGTAGKELALSPLRYAAGKGYTLGLPEKAFWNLRTQYFNNAANNAGKRYFGTNLNKQWKQLLKDTYVYDSLVNENLISGTSWSNPKQLVHWDTFGTGSKYGRGVATYGTPDKFVRIENGKFVPAPGAVRSKTRTGIVEQSAEQHPIFWGVNEPWKETPSVNNTEQLLEFTKLPNWAKNNMHKAVKEVENTKIWNLRNKNNVVSENNRYLTISPEKITSFEPNVTIGSGTGPVDITDVQGLEWNPLTKTFSKVKYQDPSKISVVTPQQAATTVNFDPRVKPMSRPISRGEVIGMPRDMRYRYGLSDAEYKKVLDDANEFATKYEYSAIEDSPEALRQIQDMYRRHNTFGRVVHTNQDGMNGITGFGPEHFQMTPQQRGYIAATEGYPYGWGEKYPHTRVFVTSKPDAVTNYSAGHDDVLAFAVRRRINLGHDPKQWRANVDFELGEPSSSLLPNEVRATDSTSSPFWEVNLGTGQLSARPLVSPAQLSGKFGKPVNEFVPSWLQQQGFRLPLLKTK